MTEKPSHAPLATFARLADVHRGWCNYCQGQVEACRNCPEGGSSLRDYERELSASSETVPTHPTGITFEKWLGYQPYIEFEVNKERFYTASTLRGAWIAGSQCVPSAIEPNQASREVADRIFYAIKHGDDEHQGRLRNKCNEIAPQLVAALSAPPEGGPQNIPEEVVRQQQSLLHPATQVFFRAGLLACREYMARFVEAQDAGIAASIRANWWPSLGQDFGPPRPSDWAEYTEGEYGTEAFRVKNKDEVSPTQEALPIALQFLQSNTPE